MPANVAKPADFTIRIEGTLFLFEPNNSEAEMHLRENTDDEAQWFGGALAVEHRYAEDLARVLQDTGYTLEP